MYKGAIRFKKMHERTQSSFLLLNWREFEHSKFFIREQWIKLLVKKIIKPRLMIIKTFAHYSVKNFHFDSKKNKFFSKRKVITSTVKNQWFRISTLSPRLCDALEVVNNIKPRHGPKKRQDAQLQFDLTKLFIFSKVILQNNKAINL